jgi:hypothetical protein
MSRTRLTWVVPGAVVAVGLFAALDALRSSGGEPTASATTTGALTTMQTETRALVEPSASLIDEQVVRLIPGRVRTDTDYRRSIRSRCHSTGGATNAAPRT